MVLNQAISKLPERCREVFELSRFENLKNKEIAEKLDVTVSEQNLRSTGIKVKSGICKVKGKNILIGECGHASRSAKYFIPTYCGGENALPVINIMEYTHKIWKEGRLKLNPNVVTERVAYHDPCNIARQRWIIDQPRELLKAFCKNYVEMTPSGDQNICCGGGGGTVSIDEIRSYRTTVGGKLKADQIRKSGCEILVAPCANCKKQLRELVEDQGIDCQVV